MTGINSYMHYLILYLQHPQDIIFPLYIWGKYNWEYWRNWPKFRQLMNVQNPKTWALFTRLKFCPKNWYVITFKKRKATNAFNSYKIKRPERFRKQPQITQMSTPMMFYGFTWFKGPQPIRYSSIWIMLQCDSRIQR